jgi:hypothetical protein
MDNKQYLFEFDVRLRLFIVYVRSSVFYDDFFSLVIKKQDDFDRWTPLTLDNKLKLAQA